MVMDENQLSEELKENTEVVSILQSALIYYDENNRYGYALKQILPVGNYSWIYCNQDGTCLTQQFLEHVLAKQKLDLKNNPKACVIDFYANVDIELPTDCTAEQLQKAEELNLLESASYKTKPICLQKREVYEHQTPPKIDVWYRTD